MFNSLKYFALLGFMLVALVGCGNASDEAIKTATDYKEAQFNVEVNKGQDGVTQELMNKVKNKLAPFQTQEFLVEQTKNRMLTLPSTVAWAQQSNLSLEDLKFETISQDKEKKTTSLSYTAKLVLNEKDAKKITLNGVMNLTNADGSWKVTYDHCNVKDLWDLAVKN